MQSTVSVHGDSIPPSLQQCNLNHLITLLQNHDKFNDTKINQFKTQIIEYLKLQNFNGQQLSDIKRKEFSNNLIQHCDNNNRVRGPANKVWDRFNKYEFVQPEAPRKWVIAPNMSYISDEDIPPTLKQCSTHHLSALLSSHQQLQDVKYKDQLKKYLTENEIDGAALLQLQRKEFSNMVVTFCNEKKIRAAAGKLWSHLVHRENYDIIAAPGIFARERNDINNIISKFNTEYLPFHQYNAKHVQNKIKWWIYNDPRYYTNFKMVIDMFCDQQVNEENILSNSIGNIKKSVMDKLILSKVFQPKTIEIMMQSFEDIVTEIQQNGQRDESEHKEEEKEKPPRYPNKTAPQIARIIYHKPLQNLLNKIHNDGIDGQTFMTIYGEKERLINERLDGHIEDYHARLSKFNFIHDETGWLEQDVYQIEAILFRNLSMTKQDLIANMDRVMNKIETIPTEIMQQIKDRIMEFDDIESIAHKIKTGHSVNEFGENVRNLIDEIFQNESQDFISPSLSECDCHLLVLFVDELKLFDDERINSYKRMINEYLISNEIDGVQLLEIAKSDFINGVINVHENNDFKSDNDATAQIRKAAGEVWEKFKRCKYMENQRVEWDEEFQNLMTLIQMACMDQKKTEIYQMILSLENMPRPM